MTGSFDAPDSQTRYDDFLSAARFAIVTGIDTESGAATRKGWRAEPCTTPARNDTSGAPLGAPARDEE